MSQCTHWIVQPLYGKTHMYVLSTTIPPTIDDLSDTPPPFLPLPPPQPLTRRVHPPPIQQILPESMRANDAVLHDPARLSWDGDGRVVVDGGAVVLCCGW